MALLSLRYFIDLIEGKKHGAENASEPWKIVYAPIFQESLVERMRVFPDIREKLAKFIEVKLADPLSARYGKHDGPMTAMLTGFMHCHLRDDAILIYNRKNRVFELVAIVPHADIEGKRLKQTAKRLAGFKA